MVIPLNMIEPGQAGEIVFLDDTCPMGGRLKDLGFIPGAKVSCVLQKRKKNIAAYLVRSAVIALRRQDSAAVFVREIPVSGEAAL